MLNDARKAIHVNLVCRGQDQMDFLSVDRTIRRVNRSRAPLALLSTTTGRNSIRASGGCASLR